MIEIAEVVSGDTTTLNNLLKKSYSVKSSHRIIGEWNYNSILDISEFGVYRSSSPTYIKDNNYVDGRNKVFYDTVIDDEFAAPTDIQTLEKSNLTIDKYYSLYDCFSQFRPTAGVAYLFSGGNGNIVDYLPSVNELDNIPGGSASPTVKPYLAGEDMVYKYWCSATYGEVNGVVPGTTASDNSFITTDINGATIGRPYPFAVYSQEFWCNVITVKYQTHLGVPSRFYIDVLKKNGTAYNWINIFDSTGKTNIPAKNSDGELRIYRQTGSPNSSGVGSWSVLEGYEYPTQLADFLVEGQTKFDKATGESSLSEFQQEADKIIGIRLRVDTMTASGIPFELIELSPRLAVDLTDYVESYNASTTIGDQTTGLPTANTVMGTGSITLSNTDGGFFNDNPLSMLYGAIGKGIEISAYQTFLLDEGLPSERNYQIPIKKMYTENWNEDREYTVTADLYDFMKVLQSQTIPPFLVHQTFTDSPVSFAVQTVMHALGYTNIKFKDAGTDNETIQYFYAGEGKTAAEVLDKICEATQSAMYIDAFGYLVIATKDKIINRTDPTVSWWLTTEDINVNTSTGEVTEVTRSSSPEDSSYSYSEPSYLSNIMAVSKDVTEPVNDGEVSYKVKSIRKRDVAPDSPAIAVLKQQSGVINPEDLVRFSSPLAVQSVWSIDRSGNQDSNEKVLAGGVYLQDIYETRLTSYSASTTGSAFGSSGYASLNNYLSSVVLSNNAIDGKVKFIRIGFIAAATLRPYNGFLKIDNEVIQYNGIEYQKVAVDSTGATTTQKRWIFSEAEYINFVKESGPRVSTHPTGNVGIFMEFDTTGFPENSSLSSWTQTKAYAVKSDGRGMFNTEVSRHSAGAQEGVPDKYREKIITAYGFNPPNGVKFQISGTHEKKTLQNIGMIEWGGVALKGSLKGQALDDGATGSAGSAYALMQSDLADVADDKNFEDILQMSYAGDLVFQGICRTLPAKRNMYSATFTTVRSRGRLGNVLTGYSAAAGLAIDFNESNGNGYYLEFCTDLKNQKNDSAPTSIILYKVYGNNNRIKILRYQDLDKPVMPREAGMSLDKMLSAETGNMQKLSIVNKTRGDFEVYYNNKYVFSASDKDPLQETQKAFLYVRGDTGAIFDKFSAVVLPADNAEYLNQVKGYADAIAANSTDKDLVQIENNIVKNAIGSVDIDNFGSNYYQLKKIKFRYDAFPVISTILADLGRITGAYTVEDFYSDSFGGYIVVSSNRGYPIVMSSDTSYGLQVFGIPLLDITNEKVSVDTFLNNLDDNSDLKNNVLESRRKYGRKSIKIDNEYVQRLSDANRILNWIMKNSVERSTIANIDIFPNPFHEITDLVKVYSPRNNISDKNYTVTGIQYNIDGDGPKMTISVREIL